MSLRNRFIALFVAFAIAATALVGVLSWNAAQRRLDQAMEHRLLDVAAVAAELSSLRAGDALLVLGPGAEDSRNWLNVQATLRRLVPNFVDGADVFRWIPGDPIATVLVSTAPADSVGIGQELSWVQPYLAIEVSRAHDQGSAATGLVEADDGELYKYVIWKLADGAFLGERARADIVARLAR